MFAFLRYASGGGSVSARRLVRYSAAPECRAGSKSVCRQLERAQLGRFKGHNSGNMASNRRVGVLKSGNRDACKRRHRRARQWAVRAADRGNIVPSAETTCGAVAYETGQSTGRDIRAKNQEGYPSCIGRFRRGSRCCLHFPRVGLRQVDDHFCRPLRRVLGKGPHSDG